MIANPAEAAPANVYMHPPRRMDCDGDRETQEVALLAEDIARLGKDSKSVAFHTRRCRFFRSTLLACYEIAVARAELARAKELEHEIRAYDEALVQLARARLTCSRTYERVRALAKTWFVAAAHAEGNEKI